MKIKYIHSFMSVGTLEEQSAGRKKLVMSVIHFDSNKH